MARCRHPGQPSDDRNCAYSRRRFESEAVLGARGMSYFEPPPERELDDEPVAEWWWAPRDELGEEIALEQVIAESDKAHVTLRSLVVYSNGFELRILGEWVEGALDVFIHTIVEPQSEQFLRIAVEFADGRRATNMDYAKDDDDESGDDDDEDVPPEKPYMG